jgi:hypothetical protein
MPGKCFKHYILGLLKNDQLSQTNFQEIKISIATDVTLSNFNSKGCVVDSLNLKYSCLTATFYTFLKFSLGSQMFTSQPKPLAQSPLKFGFL